MSSGLQSKHLYSGPPHWSSMPLILHSVADAEGLKCEATVGYISRHYVKNQNKMKQNVLNKEIEAISTKQMELGS